MAYVPAMVGGQSSIINFLSPGKIRTNSLPPQMHSFDLVRNLVNVILPPKISTAFFQNLSHAKFIVLICMDIRLLFCFYQRSKCSICMITAHFNFFFIVLPVYISYKIPNLECFIDSNMGREKNVKKIMLKK